MLEKTNIPYPADLPVLTSLRFWAAYGVAFFHYCVISIGNTGIDVMNIPVISKFHLGVDFFFVLSGFILTHVYREKLAQGKISIRDFYIKRIARVYPVFMTIFFLTLIELYGFYALGVTDKPESVTPINFILYTLGLHAWLNIEIAKFNPPSWSISAEWFAYLLFPFMLWGMGRLHYLVQLCISVLCAVICWELAEKVLGEPLTQLTFNMGILRILPEFLFGMALYQAGLRYRLRLHSTAAFFALVGIMLLAMAFLIPDYGIVIIFGAIILLGAEQGRAGYTGPLTRKNPVYLGEISYSVYLLHIPMLEMTLSILKTLHLPDDSAMAAIALCFIGIIPAAMLSYAVIEHPARIYIIKRFVKSGL
ncbi:MAG: acyltransferase [Alphaproteobacteria bacterium]|nr:acyltransferase [Alphaproteobacteria bacterium]